MQCAQDNQEDFIWVVMWARRVKEKEWTNAFGQCGAEQHSDYGATNKTPRNLEVHHHSKPNNIMNISQ